jgi:hypothetical protein
MCLTEISENLGFVFKALKDLKFDHCAPKSGDHHQNEVIKELVTVVSPAKKGDSFDQDLLRRVLQKAYREKLVNNQGSSFFHFRKLVENSDYLEGLKFALSKTN